MTDLREAAQMALDALDKLLDKLNADICDNSGIWDEYCDGGNAMQALSAALAQPEQEPVGNTITFMTRAIFNIVADHQEINGGYFIADGDVAAFVDRLAKVINSTFEPLKHKGSAPPQREWQGLTDEDIRKLSDDCAGVRDENEFIRAIEAKLKEKNT